MTIGIAACVAIVGRPTTTAAIMHAHRANWIFGAAVMGALAVLFSTAYPSARPTAPTAPTAPTSA